MAPALLTIGQTKEERMAMSEPVAATWLSGGFSSSSGSAKQRHDTIVLVQWALAIACAYLVLFSSGSPGDVGLGALVIVAFLASNLVVGRLRPAVVTSPQFNLGVAVFDTLLITISLYAAAQLSIELVVLCLGILIMAVAGLRLAVIAAASAGMMLVYALIVAVTGSESLWASSTLLRVPFLFTAAITYAWLVEVGRSHGAEEQPAPARIIRELTGDLSAQRDAIARCQSAVGQGAKTTAETALLEIAVQNETMQAKLVNV